MTTLQSAKAAGERGIATDKSTQWVYAVLKEAGIQFKQRGRK